MARRLPLLFAAATSLWASATWAQSPTPMPVETATPSPAPSGVPAGTPIPLGSTTITVRFLHQGQPLILDTLPPPTGEAYADGQSCQFLVHPTPLRDAFASEVAWPQRADPPSCSQLGALVRLCFPEAGCAETRWQGSNITVDLEVSRPGVSVVTARFMKDGQAIAITPTEWSYESNGEACSKAVLALSLPAISSASRFWPTFCTAANSSCAAAGSSIQVRSTSREYGVGMGTFTWSGASLDFDVTFGPSASPLPAGLPNTGSPPADSTTFPMPGATLLIMSILGGFLLLRRKRRRQARL